MKLDFAEKLVPVLVIVHLHSVNSFGNVLDGDKAVFLGKFPLAVFWGHELLPFLGELGVLNYQTAESCQGSQDKLFRIGTEEIDETLIFNIIISKETFEVPADGRTPLTNGKAPVEGVGDRAEGDFHYA